MNAKISFTNKVANKVVCTDKLCDYHTLFTMNALRDAITTDTNTLDQEGLLLSKLTTPQDSIIANYSTNNPSKITLNEAQRDGVIGSARNKPLSSTTKTTQVSKTVPKAIKAKVDVSSTKTRSTCAINKKLYSGIDINTKLNEYKFDGNTIFVIQNSLRLINFFSYFKKPCEPTIYMYIETSGNHNRMTQFRSEARNENEDGYPYSVSQKSQNEAALANGNIVFVASCASAFPAIIAKFPIRAPNIKAISTGNCYEFPLKNITSYIQKTDRTNGYYVMTLKHEDSNLVLEYVSLISDSTSKCNTVYSVNKTAALHSVFFDKINSDDLFNEDASKDIDYNQQINSMEVLMLVNGTEEINTGTKRIIENSNQQMIISNEDIKLTQRGKVDIIEQLIAFKKNAIIWKLDNEFKDKFTLTNETDNTQTVTLNMTKYTNLFKNYDKITQPNDSIYYALCKWRSYKNTDTYMFMKIISAGAINTKSTVRNMGGLTITKDDNSKILFGDLFSGIELVFEMYHVYTI